MKKARDLMRERTHSLPEIGARYQRALCLTGALVILSSCGEQQRMIAPARGDATKWVTGAAAQRLDESGHFILAVAPAGELSDPQARTLAQAYLRRGSRWLADVWQRDRGSDIDFDALTICPTAYYARPVLDLHGAGTRSLQQWLGPKWLFAACTPGGVPVVSIAVSSLARELSVVNGHITGPGGGQFTSAGIPNDLPMALITPEQAVQVAAQRTGRLVAAVPELVLPPPPAPPQLARWRIELDRPVNLVGQNSRRRVSTDVVYVGPGETWRATDLQLGIDAGAPTVFRDAEGKGTQISVSTPRGYAIHFERAAVDSLASGSAKRMWQSLTH
jgi:hypothetical protein